MSDPGKAVFLSYASQDAEAAKRICEALRAAGVEVWFDQSELVGGDQWDGKIRGQISSCALFMPVISANTQARLEGYFRIEWKIAARRTHAMASAKAFLLPVVIDDTHDAAAHVPDEFRDVQWTRLKGGETPPEFAQRVKQLLGGETDAGNASSATGGARSGRAQTSTPVGRSTPVPARLPRWLRPILVSAAIIIAVLTITLISRRQAGPTAAAPTAASTATAEIASVRSNLRPDEWTRADFDAFVPVADRLIQANPENGEAWALRGIANSLLVIRNLDTGTKPLQTGKEAADRALRLAPGSPLAELSLGLHLVAMISRGGDPLACRAPIDRAVAGLPPDENLTRYAELASYWLGYQFKGTEKTARAWLAAAPSAGFPAWILAQSALVRRQPAEAVKWAAQASADPEITGVRSFVTAFEVHYYLQADLAAAQAALDRVPAGQRSVPRVLASRWLVAMAGNHFDQALQELSRSPDAMLRDRLYHGPKALLAGFAHEAAGRSEVARAQFGEAEKILRTELTADPDNQELRAVLALSLACLGRADEARQELAAVEPLLTGQNPTVYTGHLILLIAQVHGVLGEIDRMVPWLRTLFTKPTQVPFTPASLRQDPRFGRYAAEPQVRALLAEFASLDIAPPGAVAAVDDKSVAVLAFANLSDDKGNEYFSDGISEELLNVLAKVPKLKVAARTSSFYFKGKDTPIPEIAQKLGVAYVVEGSVRKAGNQVRITAQLIKAADGFHVWSDTFTRDLKDIFAVQDEIAGLVAQQLQLKLGIAGGQGRSSGAATTNLAAYDAYLRGRAIQNNIRTGVGLADASRFFEEAVRLDPGYALAWVRAAEVATRLYSTGFDGSAATARTAQTAIAEALRLDPALPEARLAKAQILMEIDHDYAAAGRELDAVEQLVPGHASIPALRATIAYRNGRWDLLPALTQEAAAADPHNTAVLADLAGFLVLPGRFADADRLYDLAVAGGGAPENMVFSRVDLLMKWTGDVDGALALAETLPESLRRIGRFHSQRAWLRRLKGDLHGAIADFEAFRQGTFASRADRSGPRGLAVSSIYRIACIEEELGHGDRAARLFDETLAEADQLRRDFPENGSNQWHTIRAYILARRGQADAALAEALIPVQRAESEQDVPSTLEYRRNRAIVFGMVGRMDEAVAELRAIGQAGYAFGYGLRTSQELLHLKADPRLAKFMAEEEAKADAQPRPNR
jgi:TolB-like protein/Flp pilus assembly protein TadD